MQMIKKFRQETDICFIFFHYKYVILWYINKYNFSANL